MSATVLDHTEFARIIGTYRDYFAGGHDVVVTSAPGRLDVMGGIADYSGSLVLQLPLSAATFVAAQRIDEEELVIASTREDERCTIALADLDGLEYDSARRALTADAKSRWCAYVAGVLVVLQHERGIELDRGLRLLIHSAVPAGKGVASSAALEVAVMRAVARIYEIDIIPRDLAILCQMVENRVVGAPCGVMDQMTSSCGEPGRLLALLCQPAEVLGHVAVPDALELWGVDSGIRHEVGGADYGAVRTGAFMGLRIISDLAPDDTRRWRGYLANVTPKEWQDSLRETVPIHMNGEQFLKQYGDTDDTVTRVDPARNYAVRQPTQHPIFEHARVEEFKRLLEGGAESEAVRLRLGALMYESHASYSACGLGSSGTDKLVELVHEVGAPRGLYGAKITGGGSGGTVAVLAQKGKQHVIEAIARQYTERTGHPASLLS